MDEFFYGAFTLVALLKFTGEMFYALASRD